MPTLMRRTGGSARLHKTLRRKLGPNQLYIPFQLSLFPFIDVGFNSVVISQQSPPTSESHQGFSLTFTLLFNHRNNIIGSPLGFFRREYIIFIKNILPFNQNTNSWITTSRNQCSAQFFENLILPSRETTRETPSLHREFITIACLLKRYYGFFLTFFFDLQSVS